MEMNKWLRRILTLCLAMALVLSSVPGGNFGFKAEAVSTADRVADEATYDSWKNYFPTAEGQLHTEESGAVWTDKSVFEPADKPAAWTDVSIADTGDNFLVALSALASNKIVKGYSNLPTDTMLVLDVSGSMNNSNSGNNSADEMVEAANAAIDRLLKLNLNNRVGVVLYSGNSSFGNSNTGTAQVILPLDRYTTTANDNSGDAVYLNHTMPGNRNSETVSINSAVRIEGGAAPAAASKTVEGGTYIQNGIWKAAQQLLEAENTVTTGVQAGTVRMPIMVLMSDGAPTVATNAYTEPGTSNRGDGGDTSDAMGFLTQLTAAYSWAKIEDHYGRDGRFYTLGLGVSGSNIAEAVLDPANETTNNIRNYWTRYLALNTDDSSTRNDTMDLNTNSNNAADTVRRDMTVDANARYYVTKYYEATGNNLGQSLLTAFNSIVDEIVLQSRYYPTLVDEGDPDVDGYVTFRDEIGLYMEVTDIKGIRLNGVLHTGELLAQNFVEGGGDLGTLEDPTSLGDELVWAVQKRLGIEDANEARALLNNAYEYGQLDYNGPGDFSNYIGWFGDADDRFLDFWYEGMPEEDYPADAHFINKSYGFLGDVDTAHGIAASDMMYTMVRVRERIKESNGQKVGEVIVDWSIPAALVPTITYVVELNGETYDSGVKDLSVETWKNASNQTVAYAPMRLMYEVALRSDINELNVAEKTNGTTTFYTNAWNSDEEDTSVNTFSHFEPSTANERFYFIENKTIYVQSGTGYVPYTGSEPAWAEDTYYHQHTHFDADAGDNGVVTVYEPLTQATFGAKKAGANNTWYIPAGTIHRYYHNVEIVKGSEANKTNTLNYSLYPHIESSGTHYYVTSTLGNNGKLTVAPATGILLTKELEGADAANLEFTFEITGGSETAYTVTPLNADGSYGTAYQATVTGGKATVTLKPGQTVYVTGMTAGTTYTITEQNAAGFKVQSITGGTASGSSVTVQAEGQTIKPVVFTNAPKGVGGVYITKVVTSDTSFPAAEFDITVTLSGNENTPTVTSSAAETPTYSYEPATGTITGLKIVHGQTYYISNLTEGTVVTVTETIPGSAANFAEGTHTSIDYSGDSVDNDAIVTIPGGRNSTVVLNNTYTAPETSVHVDFSGIKNFDATEMTVNSEFTFKLQKWSGSAWVDVDGKTGTVTVAAAENAPKTFTIPSLSLTFDEIGTHSYQIVEVKGDNTDITYDASVYTFGIEITDNGDGTLKATLNAHTEDEDEFSAASNGTNSWLVNTTFTNEYHTAATYLDIKKEINDPANTGVSPAGFKFATYNATVVDNGDGTVTWTLGDYIRSNTVDAQGEVRVIRNYDASDFVNDTDGDGVVTYHFIIKEEQLAPEANTAAGVWGYDTTEYRVTVILTKDATSGNITAKFVIDRVKADGTVENVVAEAAGQTSATLQFTNTYTPKTVTILDPINATPTVMKEMVGRDLAANEFDFQIVDANGTVVATGKNLADGAMGDKETAGDNIAWVNFTEVNKGLTFNKVGTYHFKVQEVEGNLASVSYTNTIYDMVVTVTEANGQLEADYFFEDSTGKTVTFTNTYEAEATELSIQGSKTLTGGRHLLSGEFHFDLVEMTDSSFQTAKTDGVTLSTNNSGAEASGNNAVGGISFPAIPYDKVGTYYYKITERTGGLTDLGVTYSTDAAYVTVKVTDNTETGKLEARATYTMRDAGGTAMNFVNTYKALPVNSNFSVSKELEGRTLDDGEFTFGLFKATVTGSGEEAVWTAEDTAKQTVENNEDGIIEFADLTFSDVGTYRYIVKEIAPEDVDSEGNKEGVHYDTTEFRITIVVTDNWRGRLETETTIVDQNGLPYEVLVFNNTYTIADDELNLEGTKTLTGRDMEEGETFTFIITENGEEVSRGTVTGATDGKQTKFAFDPIPYTKDDIGTHTYVVAEQNDGTAGVNFDGKTYTVVVHVSDNRDGTLKIELDSSNPGVLAFANTYTKPADVTLDVTAVKTVKNTGDLEIGPEDFQFQVVDVESNEKVTGTSGEDGNAVMKLTFTAEDAGKTFTYRISEVDTGKDNVTYSTVTYTIKVAVALDKQTNKLVLTVTNNDKTIEKVLAPFENVYHEDIPETPNTGDETNLMLYGMLLMASAAALVLLMVSGKKRAHRGN